VGVDQRRRKKALRWSGLISSTRRGRVSKEDNYAEGRRVMPCSERREKTKREANSFFKPHRRNPGGCRVREPLLLGGSRIIRAWKRGGRQLRPCPWPGVPASDTGRSAAPTDKKNSPNGVVVENGERRIWCQMRTAEVSIGSSGGKRSTECWRNHCRSNKKRGGESTLLKATGKLSA